MAVLGQRASPAGRRAVDRAWLEALGERSQTYAALLQGIVEQEKLIARARGFDSALSARLDGDAIPAETVRHVVAAARDTSAALRRYHSLRKKALELDGYGLADRFVPSAERGRRSSPSRRLDDSWSSRRQPWEPGCRSLRLYETDQPITGAVARCAVRSRRRRLLRRLRLPPALGRPRLAADAAFLHRAAPSRSLRPRLGGGQPAGAATDERRRVGVGCCERGLCRADGGGLERLSTGAPPPRGRRPRRSRANSALAERFESLVDRLERALPEALDY